MHKRKMSAPKSVKSKKNKLWNDLPRDADHHPLLDLDCVQRVQIDGVKMMEDPKMKQCGKWSKYSFVKGPQGVGKSHAAMESAVARTLVSGECCVHIAPSRSLAQQAHKDIQRFLEARGDKRRVLLYMEDGARNMPADEWDFLVLGPLSARHFVAIIVQRGLGMLFLDELPEIQDLLTGFIAAGRENLAVARAALAALCSLATNVVAISAQTVDSNIQWLLGLNPDESPKQTMVMYQSSHVPPMTELMTLASVPHALRVLSKLVVEGKKVVCFTETVVMALRLREWVDIEHNGATVSIAFTADINDAADGIPGSDITSYLKGTGCGFFVHTSALGLGMNLLTEFDARVVVADKGFISMKKVAQELGRARNLTSMVAYVYLGHDNSKPPTGSALDREAQALVAAQHPDSVTPFYSRDTGKLLLELTATPETAARLALAKETVSERGSDARATSLVGWLDHAQVVGNAPGYYDQDEKSKTWEDIIKREKGLAFQDWTETTLYLQASETLDMCLQLALRGDRVSAATRAVVHSNIAVSKLMPHMVRDSSQIGGHALTKEFLFDVHKNYALLDNLLRCVASTSHNDTLQVHISQTMFPEEGGVPPPQDKDIRGVAFAVLTACAGHVKLKLSNVANEEEQDVFALAAVTPTQKTAACKWLERNWSHGVRCVMLAVAGRQPAQMPVFNSQAWWKFVKSFLRLGFGFGLRVDPSTGMRDVVANSFYGKHNVDVLAVIAQHREQTRVPPGQMEHPTTTHNGRKFGQYPAMLRHCDMCLPGGPQVQCVRQFGAQWLCMACRDYRTAIDVGYLDVEPPPNNPESVMTVEEIFANDLALHSTAVDQEEEEVDRKHAGGGEQEHIMRLVLSDLPPVVLRLLHDLGFVAPRFTVTSVEMRFAWENAVGMEYLARIDQKYGSELAGMARRGDLMKSMRPVVFKIALQCGLRVVTGRCSQYQKGEARLSTYTLVDTRIDPTTPNI
jgi:hypothetical protein